MSRAEDRLCDWCGSSLAGRRRHARFCTDTCRAKAHKPASAFVTGSAKSDDSDSLTCRLSDHEHKVADLEQDLREHVDATSAALAAMSNEAAAEMVEVARKERGALGERLDRLEDAFINAMDDIAGILSVLTRGR